MSDEWTGGRGGPVDYLKTSNDEDDVKQSLQNYVKCSHLLFFNRNVFSLHTVVAITRIHKSTIDDITKACYCPISISDRSC